MAAPGDFLANNQSTITRILGLLALLIIGLVVLSRLVWRAGGWRAVRRRLGREIRLTAAAFAAPLRRWLVYRRQLRRLRRLFRDPHGWQASELAFRRVHALLSSTVDGDGHRAARPYAALFDGAEVGVFVAGRELPDPPRPWTADDSDPRLWWISAAGATSWQEPGAAPPPVLLTGVGLWGRHLVLLDLAGGPHCVGVDGDARAASSIVGSIAAQLDHRLPDGSVVVAQGVHPRHPGPPADVAIRLAGERATAATPAWAVCAAMPRGGAAGRWGETRDSTGVRLLVRGPAHGHARLCTTDRAGKLTVHGTPLRIDTAALPRAVSRTTRFLPPYQPPVVPAGATAAGWDDERLGRSARPAPAAATPASAGPATARPTDPQAGVSEAPTGRTGGHAALDELAEPAGAEAALGVSAAESDGAQRPDLTPTSQQAAANPGRGATTSARSGRS